MKVFLFPRKLKAGLNCNQLSCLSRIIVRPPPTLWSPLRVYLMSGSRSSWKEHWLRVPPVESRESLTSLEAFVPHQTGVCLLLQPFWLHGVLYYMILENGERERNLDLGKKKKRREIKILTLRRIHSTHTLLCPLNSFGPLKRKAEANRGLHSCRMH